MLLPHYSFPFPALWSAGCPHGLFNPPTSKLGDVTQQQIATLRVLSKAQCEQTVRRLVRLAVFEASHQGVVKFSSMEKCLPSGVKPRHVWPLLRLVNDRLRALFGLELRKKLPSIQTFAAQAKVAARNARAGKQKPKKTQKGSSRSSKSKKGASPSSAQPRQFIVVNITAPAPRITNWGGNTGQSSGGFPQLDADQMEQALRCDTHYAELAKGPTGIQKAMRGLAITLASLILGSDKVDERGKKYVNSKTMRKQLEALFKCSIDSGSGSHFGGVSAVKLVKILTAQHYLATSEDPEEERDGDGRILQAYWVGQRLEEEVGPHALLHFATALCKRDLGANEWKHFAKAK